MITEINNKRKLIGLLIVSLVVISYPLHVKAHPGNTDSYGCHTCYTNCPSYGLFYGEYHCHTPKINYQPVPVYIPKPVYVQPWSCTIKGEKYYDSNSAISKWRSLVHNAVDSVYRVLLERTSNQNDYNYWESKIPYNNCSFMVDSKKISDEVLNSDERKDLLEKKADQKKAQEEAVRKANELGYQDSIKRKNEGSSTNVLFWIVGMAITVFVIYLIDKAIRKSAKDEVRKCQNCNRTIPKGKSSCPSCYKGSKE